MTRVLVTRLCYFLAQKEDAPNKISSFTKVSELTHTRFGPFPYSEFGTEKTWNPANKESMLCLFNNITNGVCLMENRQRQFGDIAVISDGEWRTYGVITDHKKGGSDEPYDIIREPGKRFGFLKVGDGFFMLHNPKIVNWVKCGDPVYDKR
tara:strand:+ start:13269 stop:13721 length:453 start_codon:yes stop_codon:yes gene_type:complete